MIAPLLLCVIAFLIGAIPTGYVVGRIYGVDIRQHGSGNIGATNAGRLLGKKAGTITFIGDAGKGILAAVIPIITSQEPAETISPFTTTLALVGHCYSPFLNFHGGKGVATGCGGFLYVTPIPTLVACAVFAITRKISGFVSIGSISAALSFALLVLFDFIQPTNWQTKAAAIACTLIIILRHRENLSRLAHHAELPGTNLEGERAPNLE